MSKALALCLIFFASTQLLTFFQMNGQFLSEWCKNHPFTLSLLGVPISYGFIMATKYAFIEFGGGCQGCGMAGQTLSMGMETKLLKAFPELKGLMDGTNHSAAGKRPFRREKNPREL